MFGSISGIFPQHRATDASAAVLSFRVSGTLAAICSFQRLFGQLSTSNEEQRQSQGKASLLNFSAFQVSGGPILYLASDWGFNRSSGVINVLLPSFFDTSALSLNQDIT